jgi:uncharacterized membrane protein (DUF485 family)
MSALSRHIVRDHVMASGVVALVSVFFWGWVPAMLFWFASIFIDADHWFGFLYRTRFRFWGPSSMMRFYEYIEYTLVQNNSKGFLNIDIFHTVEFVCVLGVMAFAVAPVLQPIFWGVMFHLFVDWIYLSHRGVFHNRCYTLWEYITRRKRIIAQGLDPDRIFRQALKTLEN